MISGYIDRKTVLGEIQKNYESQIPSVIAVVLCNNASEYWDD